MILMCRIKKNLFRILSNSSLWKKVVKLTSDIRWYICDLEIGVNIAIMF